MERDAQVHPPAGVDEHAPGQRPDGHDLLRPWADREEVRALPEILRPAEELVAVGTGTVVKSARLARSNWLVLLTDRRLLCIKGAAAATRKVIDMPVSQIRGVESSGLFRRTLSLDTGFGTLRIGELGKGFAAEVVDGLTTLMGAYEDTAGPPKAAPSGDAAEPGSRSRQAGELDAVADTMASLEQKLEALTDRVVFLEELVRSNVASQPDPTEAG